MAQPAHNPAHPEIPDKLYFRIGEVSELAGIKPYVLRFWESEFPALGPKKSGTGHRLYRRKDVELVLEIKHLLYEKRYTIEGARLYLDSRPRNEALRPTEVPPPKAPPRKPAQGSLFAASPVLEDMRRELVEILEMLS